MEAAEIDEGVGAKEEVGNDGGDGVEFSFKDPGREGQNVGWALPQELPSTHSQGGPLAWPGLDAQSTQPSHLRIESFAP